MKSSLPKGLLVLSLITIVGSTSIIKFLLRPDGHMIFAGQLLQGIPFKIYYSAICIFNLLIGIGLLLRRKWSYLCFMTFSLYSALLAIANIIVTDNETLARAGWTVVDDNLKNFRIIQAIVLCIIGLMIIWLRRYRGEFRAYSTKIGPKPTV